MWCIVYTRAEDGGVSVLRAAPQGRLAKESEADWQGRIMSKDVPADAINPRVIAETELPEYDAATRDAWRDDGRSIAVDESKVRTPALDPLAELTARIAALEGKRTLKA